MSRLAFGFMTGTSCDGLDGAAVRVRGAGVEMRCEVVAGVSLDLGALAGPARRLARGGGMTAGEIARLALGLGELHAEGVRRLRAELRNRVGKAGAPDLVAVHGQTVFHDPPASWQLVNPWPVARAAACPVVSDLRGADLAAGGQGAPITPIADWVLLRDARGEGAGQTRVVVNLGGFCNITLLPGGAPPEAIQARDVCACNHMLDAAARVALGEAFDADGAAAARGWVDQALRVELEGMLAGQGPAGRSLGSADEMVGEVERLVADRLARGGEPRQVGSLPHPSGRGAGLSPDDALATTVAAVAGAIGAAVNELSPAPDLVLVAGGSVRNAALMVQLAAVCRAPVVTTADFGVDPQYREAAAMAIVGCLAHDGAPVALPHVTGAREPILWSGSWTNLPPAPMR